MTAEEGEQLIRDAITGRPRRVSDKAKLRFALFRAPRSRRLLGIALHLLDRYPEHIDAILTYLALHRPSKSIDKALRNALNSVANEYARGELWRFAARSGTPSLVAILLPEARSDLAQKDKPFWQRLGALTLLRAESLGLLQASGKIRFEAPLAQALLARSFSNEQFSKQGAIGRLLRHNTFEPSLALSDQIAARGESHRTYGVTVGEIAPVTQNVLRELGVIARRRKSLIDDVRRPSLPTLCRTRQRMEANPWSSYGHALLRLLILADSQYDSSRSLWLQHLNSFNDILARRVIFLLARNGLPGGARTVAKDGKLVKMGNLVQSGGAFDTANPVAASAFRATNDRRNKLPSAHPYDEKTGQRNRHLIKKEDESRLHSALSAGYSALQPVLTTIP